MTYFALYRLNIVMLLYSRILIMPVLYADITKNHVGKQEDTNKSDVEYLHLNSSGTLIVRTRLGTRMIVYPSMHLH